METENKTNSGAALTGLLLIFPLLAWKGFVASKLILWFFNHTLSLPVACGLCLVVQLLIMRGPPKEDFTWERLWSAVWHELFLPAVFLGMGFLIQLFI